MAVTNWDGKEKYDALLDKCVVKNGSGNKCFSLAMLDDEDIRWMARAVPSWDWMDITDDSGNSLLDIAEERGLTPLAIEINFGNMNLYRVTTTFLGADAPSKFYFNRREKAEKFLQEECQNGVCEEVRLENICTKNYFDGCTINDLASKVSDTVEIVNPEVIHIVDNDG